MLMKYIFLPLFWKEGKDPFFVGLPSTFAEQGEKVAATVETQTKKNLSTMGEAT